LPERKEGELGFGDYYIHEEQINDYKEIIQKN